MTDSQAVIAQSSVEGIITGLPYVVVLCSGVSVFRYACLEEFFECESSFCFKKAFQRGKFCS